jgi:hypothetical protein
MQKLKKKSLSSTVKENRSGMMEPSTMETGGMEWLKVRALFIMLMEMSILVSSCKIELMDSVFMFIQMDRDMKDSGKMIIRMDLVKKSLKMDPNTMECSKMERNGVKEPTSGQTKAFT